MMARLEARGAAAGDAAAARVREGLAGVIAAAAPDLTVAIEDDAVRIEGARAGARFLGDPALRWSVEAVR